MKTLALVLGAAFLGGLFITQVFAHGPQEGYRGGYSQMMGSGVMGGGMMGSGMMGGGMMGGGMMGGGMGQGRMGPGHGSPNGSRYRQPQEPLEEGDARAILEDYLKSTRNPNLKLGTVKDTGPSFEAEIRTKEDSLVDKVLVDKRTGGIRSVY